MSIIAAPIDTIAVAGQPSPVVWDKLRCDNCGVTRDYYGATRRVPEGAPVPPHPTGWVMMGVWPEAPQYVFSYRRDFCSVGCCRAYWRKEETVEE